MNTYIKVGAVFFLVGFSMAFIEESRTQAQSVRGKKCVIKQAGGSPNPQCVHVQKPSVLGGGSSCPATVTVGNKLSHCINALPGERCWNTCYQREDYPYITYSVTQKYTIGGMIYAVTDVVLDVLCNPVGKIIFKAMPTATVLLEIACAVHVIYGLIPPDICYMITCTAANGQKSGTKVNSCL